MRERWLIYIVFLTMVPINLITLWRVLHPSVVDDVLSPEHQLHEYAADSSSSSRESGSVVGLNDADVAVARPAGRFAVDGEGKTGPALLIPSQLTNQSFTYQHNPRLLYYKLGSASSEEEQAKRADVALALPPFFLSPADVNSPSAGGSPLVVNDDESPNAQLLAAVLKDGGGPRTSRQQHLDRDLEQQQTGHRHELAPVTVPDMVHHLPPSPTHSTPPKPIIPQQKQLEQQKPQPQQQQKPQPQQQQEQKPQPQPQQKPPQEGKKKQRALGKDIVVVRILGNVIPGRHSAASVEANLEFLLRQEPSLTGADRIWLFNRISNRTHAHRLHRLLKRWAPNDHVKTLKFDLLQYKAIPLDFAAARLAVRRALGDESNYNANNHHHLFSSELAGPIPQKASSTTTAGEITTTAFASDSASAAGAGGGGGDTSMVVSPGLARRVWDRMSAADKSVVALEWAFQRKNVYAMNNNGARNAAVRAGRVRGAQWTLPLDGECLITAAGWMQFLQTITNDRAAKQEKEIQFLQTINNRTKQEDQEPQEQQQRGENKTTTSPPLHYVELPMVRFADNRVLVGRVLQQTETTGSNKKKKKTEHQSSSEKKTEHHALLSSEKKDERQSLLSSEEVMGETAERQLLALTAGSPQSAEPQLAIHRDAAHLFDETVPYGDRPKVSLFWRLGLPGPWLSYRPFPWERLRPLPLSPEQRAQFTIARAGAVARLASGLPDDQDPLVRMRVRKLGSLHLLTRLELGGVIDHDHGLDHATTVTTDDVASFMQWVIKQIFVV